MKSKNVFYELDTHVVGVTRKGKEFLFDEEDFDRIQHFSWNLDGRGYITTSDYTFGQITILLHRMILQLEDSKIQVDHINHNTLDNRKCNLRICTQQENLMNQNLRHDNLSGYKGVGWHNASKKWQARIQFLNKRIHLGLYETKEEAARKYNEVASFYFGEFAKLNIIK